MMARESQTTPIVRRAASSTFAARDRQHKASQKRSARLAAAREKGTHTALEWEVLRAIFGGRCIRCGREHRCEKDHIEPIYQGGSDAIENLQPICPWCNTGKGSEAIDFRSVAYPRWREHYDMVIALLSVRLQHG